MLRNILLALSLAMVSTLSHAYFYDGNKLKLWAEADDRVTAGTARATDHQESFRFIGYITGVYDSADGLNICCQPENLKVGQMVGIVKKYLYNNPEVWDRSGDSIVISAMKQSFPCRK